MEGSGFNPDELTAQTIAGGGPRGGGAIRNFMPEQHREFFAQLPYLLVGAAEGSGNRYFNTLGNLMVEPRASLLFVDFETGDLLQLQGTAQVEWDGDAADRIAGAERLWRFNVVRGWRRKSASPLRWSFVEYSRTTVATGVWRSRSSSLST